MSKLILRKGLTIIRKTKPTPSDVHINGPLTNVAVAYFQSAAGFIADRVFPTVNVAKKSDLYYIYPKEELLRDEAKVRAPGTESAGGGFAPTTSNYDCRVEAFHKDIDDQLRGNADSVLQLDTAATRFVMSKMMIRREASWFTTYFNTGIWGTDITGVASGPSTGEVLQWNAAASTPRADVDAGRLKIGGETGRMPNTLVIGPHVLTALRSNAEVRDQFKYTSAESIDTAMLARYFGIERVLVPTAIWSTGNEGGANTTQFFAGKKALLCYTTDAPALMEPTAGYTFQWTGVSPQGAPIALRRYRIDPTRSDRIEAEMAYTQKVVSTDLGYFFDSIVA